MEQIQLTDFLRYAFLSAPAFSPDGSKIALLRHQCDLETNGYQTELWTADPATGETAPLPGNAACSSFFWLSPHALAVSSGACGGQTVYERVCLSSGNRQPLFTVPVAVERIEPLCDGRYAVQALHRIADSDAPPCSEPWEPDTAAYSVYDELPFIENVRNEVNKLRRRLYLFDPAAGSLVPLSGPLFDVEQWTTDAAGRRIAYFGSSYEHVRSQQLDVFVYDIARRQQEKVMSAIYARKLCFMGDDLMVAATDMQEYGLYQCPDWFLIDAHGASRHLGRSPYVLDNGTCTDCAYGSGNDFLGDESGCYATATTRYGSQILHIDKKGATRLLAPADGAVECFALCGGRLAYIAMQGQSLEELRLLDLASGEDRQLGSFNGEVLRGKNVIRPLPLRFVNSRGVEIDGWVLLPAGYRPDGSYPGILNIHGGPKGIYNTIFFHEMQVMANAGYFVFFCNPTGSTGRGDDFTDLRGKYGTVDYTDLMEFTDAVLRQYPSLDPTRLGVAGGSYGGFMVNWVIGHTDRFRAAASQRSISNFVANFCISDIGYFFDADEHAATPWDGMERLWQMSPLRYADQVHTPTLFLQSDEDFRCPLVEAYQMFGALRYFGVETRLVVFHGENHHLSRSGRPKNRITRMKEILYWFDRHLQPAGGRQDG